MLLAQRVLRSSAMGTRNASNPWIKISRFRLRQSLPNRSSYPPSGRTMSGKQATFAVLIMGGSILAASAAAQDEKNEVSGIVGRTFHQRSRLSWTKRSHHQSFCSLRQRARLRSQLVEEIWVPRSMPSRWKCLLFSISMRTSSPVAISFPPMTSRSLSLPRSAQICFQGPGFSPWVSLGGGFGHFSESNQLNCFGTNLGGSSSTGVIQAGLGLDVSPFQKGFSHFSFRGEVRDFYFRYS